MTGEKEEGQRKRLRGGKKSVLWEMKMRMRMMTHNNEMIFFS